MYHDNPFPFSIHTNLFSSQMEGREALNFEKSNTDRLMPKRQQESIQARRHNLASFPLLLLLFIIPSSSAFSSYLLSKANCWTDLSTEEVVMNYPITAAADSDDPRMQVIVVGHTTLENPVPVYTMPENSVFPLKVALQVLTDHPQTDPDYQWAMEVNGTDAHFAEGACDNKRRVAGRAKEMVELTLDSVDSVARVWAGWACGHEAVRLTPVLTIQGKSAASVEEKETSSVADLLPDYVSEEGCTTYSSLVGGDFEKTLTGLSDSKNELSIQDADEVNNILTIGSDDKSWDTMVMHTSKGSSFLGDDKPCSDRVALTPQDPWPQLSLSPEARTVVVHAIVSKQKSNGSFEYKRISSLTLEWTPSEEEKKQDEKKQDSVKYAAENVKEIEEPIDEEEVIEAVKKVNEALQHVDRRHRKIRDIEREKEDETELPVAENEKKPIDKEPGPEVGLSPTLGSWLRGLSILLGVNGFLLHICVISSRKYKGRLDL